MPLELLPHALSWFTFRTGCRSCGLQLTGFSRRCPNCATMYPVSRPALYWTYIVLSFLMLPATILFLVLAIRGDQV